MKEQNTEKDDHTNDYAVRYTVPESTPEQKEKSDRITKMIKRQLFKRREINNRHAFRKFY